MTAYGGNGPLVLGLAFGLCISTVILVLLRLYAASIRAGKLRWDFFWAAFALVWNVACHICFVIAVYNGLGNHVKQLSFTQLFTALKWAWMSILVGIIGGVLSKFSIIALLLEVEGPKAHGRRYLLFGIGALVGVIGLIQTFLSLFKCHPVERLWNPTIPGACPRDAVSAKFSYAQGAVSALTDIALALYPISIVWNLQTTRNVKIGFCCLMAGGLIPAIAVIVRTTQLKRLPKSKDITYDFSIFILCAALELWTVLLLGSIPPLRPLFLRVFYGITSQVTSKGDRSLGTAAKAGESRQDALMSKNDKAGIECVTEIEVK